MRSFLTYLSCLLFSINGFSQSSLDGIVYDIDSLPVPFANIALYQNGILIKGVCSDFDGYYFLDSIQKGQYNIKITYIGRIDIMKSFSFKDDDLKKIDFNFKYKYNVLSHCHWPRPKFYFIWRQDKLTIENSDISEIKIKKLNKIISTAPNVTLNKENELSFKGSRPGNEQYIIDGMRINGEVNIPTSSIYSIDVFHNGIPARYGNTTSAVIVIETNSYFDFID